MKKGNKFYVEVETYDGYTKTYHEYDGFDVVEKPSTLFLDTLNIEVKYVLKYKFILEVEFEITDFISLREIVKSTVIKKFIRGTGNYKKIMKDLASPIVTNKLLYQQYGKKNG